MMCMALFPENTALGLKNRMDKIKTFLSKNHTNELSHQIFSHFMQRKLRAMLVPGLVSFNTLLQFGYGIFPQKIICIQGLFSNLWY